MSGDPDPDNESPPNESPPNESQSESHLDDARVIAAQLGRRSRARSTVVARCHLHLPVVIAVPPVLESGEPFPTRYWLCCPLAHKRIARLEGEGGVREFDERIASDPELAAKMDAAHAHYSAERDALVPEDVPLKPSGGIAGIRATEDANDAPGVKCLHAHYAHHRGGGDNPVGRETASRVEPLDCEQPCVMATNGVVGRNPQWRAPAHPEDLVEHAGEGSS